MPLCSVLNCPAESLKGQSTCKTHIDYCEARALGIAKDSKGRGGKRCVKCRRVFKAEDMVQRKSVPTMVRRKPAAGYQHANCELPVPKLTRRQIRESVKPLLEATQ